MNARTFFGRPLTAARYERRLAARAQTLHTGRILASALIGGCVMLSPCIAAPVVVFSEAIGGDLPSTPTSTFVLGVGANTFSGNMTKTGPGNVDFDSVAFTVPAGAQLTQATWSFGTSGAATGGSLGLTTGAIPSFNTPISTAFGSASGSPVTLFGSSTPLGAGTYSIGTQSLSFLDRASPGSINYTLTLGVNSLTPTPPPPSPRTFGLFIGVRDQAGPFTAKDDVGATEVANAFTRLTGMTSITLTGDLTAGSAIQGFQIQDKLTELRSLMHANDDLVIYIASHGGSYTTDGGIPPRLSVNDSGVGNEYVLPGSDPYGSSPGLTDKQLAEWLRPFNDVNKLAFIDACHSGGFWASGDASESATTDLDGLSKIALITSASEAGHSYGDPITGTTFFEESLLRALKINPFTGHAFADLNDDGGLSNQEIFAYLNTASWIGYPGTTMFDKRFGDVVAFDPNHFNYGIRASSDAVETVVTAAVAEPPTSSLLLLALGAVGIAGRRGKADAARPEQRSP